MNSEVVRNPSNEAHYMQLDDMTQTVRVTLDGTVIAQTPNAMRLLEVGRSLYPPQYYIPEAEISVPLGKTGKSTHCPLKGNAAYFDVLDGDGKVRAAELGWAYPEPYDFASRLAGYIAFDPRRVSITIEAQEQ
jgi:uncharacterized protein (DUF427 family)